MGSGSSTGRIVIQFFGKDRTLGKTFAAQWKKADTLEKKMGLLGSRMRTLGKDMTLGVTLPMAGLGVVAWRMGSQFDSSMRQVQAASDASKQEMDQLTESAKTMGFTSMYAAQDAAAAMLELAKSGITPAQMKAGALKTTMILAAAGSLELGAAAESVANTLNMFGLRAKQAKQVANALAGGANASSASVDTLRMALAQVGPGARNAGLNLQTTVGILAAFANKGIQGSDAGTSLKTMLQRLIPMTDKQAKAMKKFGLDFTDAKGRIIPMTKVAQQLKDKLGDLTMEQRNAALTTIFGSDATRAATVLMQEGAKGIRRYVKATSDRRAASKMAAAQENSDAGKTKRAMAAIKTAAIEIQVALAPIVTMIAGLVGKAARWFGSLPKPIQKLAVAAGIFVAALGPLITVIGAILPIIGALAPVVGALVAAFQVGGIAAFGGSLAALLGPVGLVVVAIAALAVGLVIAYKKSATFREIVNTVAGVLKTVLVGAFHAIVAVVKWVIKHWRGLLDAFLLISGPVGWVVMYVIHHFDLVKRKVGAVLSWLGNLPGLKKAIGVAKTVCKAIGGFFGDLVGWVRNHWNSILQTIADFVNKIGGVINTAFGWTGIHVPTVSWGEGGSGKYSRGDLKKASGSGRKGDPSGGWDRTLGGAPSGDVSDVLSSAGSGIANAADWIFDKAGSTISGILGHLPTPPTISGPLAGLLPAVMRKIAEKLKSLITKLGGGIGIAGGKGYGWASALAQRFGLTVSSTYRPGAITAAGYPSDHGVYGRAADIAGAAGSMARLWAAIKHAPWLKQGLYQHEISNYGQVSYYAPTDHFDHVHVARNTSGDDSRGRTGGDTIIHVYIDGEEIACRIEKRQAKKARVRNRTLGLAPA